MGERERNGDVLKQNKWRRKIFRVAEAVEGGGTEPVDANLLRIDHK